MTVRLSDILAQKSTVNVRFRGFSFDVEYKPNVVTPSFKDRAISGNPSVREYYESCLLEMCVDWGVVDENDQPLPITKDSMKDMSTQLLAEIYKTVMDDLSQIPDDEEKKI